MYPLGLGRIFWKVYPGDRGGGKRRPMVVVSGRLDMNRTGRVVAVICSTTFDEADLQPSEVPLPHDPLGFTVTRLTAPTVAVCDWVADFAVAEVVAEGGIVPTHILRDICRRAGLAYPSER